MKHLLLACALLGTSTFSYGQWSATQTNLRYENTANWSDGIINDTFTGLYGWADWSNINIGSRTIAGNFTVDILDAVNTRFTPDNGAVLTFTSPKPVFLVELGGSTVAKQMTFGADSRPLTLNFSHNDATFAISPSLNTYIGTSYDTLQLSGVISNAKSITKTGGGQLILDRAVTIDPGGSLNVLGGIMRLQTNATINANATLRGASTINVVGRGSVLDIGPGASGVQYLEPSAAVNLAGGALAFGMAAGDTQQVGDVTLKGARSVIGNYRADGVNTLLLNSLNRTEDATLNLVFSTTNNGLSTPIKITGDDSNILASLQGGGGAAGSTNISILPWVTGSTVNNSSAFSNTSNDSMWSSTGFITYTSAGGFRLLADNEYYKADGASTLFSAARSTDNVSINQAALTVATSQTVNSLKMGVASTITINLGQTLTVATGAMNDAGLAYTVNGSGKLSSGDNAFIFTGRNRSNINVELTNNITDANAAGLIVAQVGSGVTLGAANTYGGKTVVQGALTVAHSGALPTATSVRLDHSGVATFGNGITSSFQRLEGAGTVAFAGVNGGSMINLGGGAGLAGNTITVNAGGVLAPGFSNEVGSLKLGANARNLTINSGGEFRFTLASASEFSMIENLSSGVNTLTINGGTLYLSFLNGYQATEGDVFTLTSGFNAFDGSVDSLTVVDLTYGHLYAASIVDNNLVVTAAAIPEPSAVAFAFGGLTLLGLSMRYRRKG